MYTLTTNNDYLYCDLILAAMSILNTYVLHDLNDLVSYALFTVHERDSIILAPIKFLKKPFYSSLASHSNGIFLKSHKVKWQPGNKRYVTVLLVVVNGFFCI